MPRRIPVNTLQASTMDILNVIRSNAPAEYQSLVPEVSEVNEIPRVGEVLYGYPALANHFISALINRIALTRLRSATFNNRFSALKKGYLEFGEIVEEVYVELSKAREFNVEKAGSREFKRTIPDVRTAFHAMNWRVQYPITIQNDDLRTAFRNEPGVRNLIQKIMDQVYTASEYDEYLLFKYLLIKAISHGKMHPVSIGSGVMTEAAVAFRGMSNMITFMSTDYNSAGVHTATPKPNQYIFMDAMYNAAYDVGVLASAFNMDKADFSGRLILIDNWSTFDNARFEEIRKNSDMIEEVTADELALLASVKAVLLDEEWFQVYDNNTVMTEVFVASGMYWNYFYNVWKTVSSSPFANAVVFVTEDVSVELPNSFTVRVTDVSTSDAAAVLTLAVDDSAIGAHNSEAQFIQTEDATRAGIAIHRYGAVIFPVGQSTVKLVMEVDGVKYTSETNLTVAATPGTTITMNKG